MRANIICRYVKLLVVVVIGFAEMQTAHAQVDMKKGELEVLPTFYFDAISYSSDVEHKSRVDVYVQVPHEEIRFLKEGDQFIARYEVTLSLFTTTRQLVHERLWSAEVRTNDFAQTASNKLYNLTQRSLDVDPGNYVFTVQVRDQESRKTSHIKRALFVPDYKKDSLSLSDIMLVTRLSTDGEKKTIVPNISNNVGNFTDGFFIFFEIYNEPALDSVDVTWSILNAKKEEQLKKTQVEAITGHKTQMFFKIDNLNLPMGSYLLTVEAVPTHAVGDAKERLKATTSRTFVSRAGDLPLAVLDFDKAVDQLIYIARESELQYIRESKNAEEKKKRFLEFWVKRDPDPQTSRNELMEEYYQRVDFANKNFSHYLEGWKTDMGMVYIRFGGPENIERHPFDYNAKPYEIWYYYQQNRQFIFVDQTGFGDYRLTYPSTDLWGRVR
ncbi:MAG: GWxTD domain-containing protein [Ignavibacteriales bacterium]|nr:GWxTD domain-containing protein [Ignavibacteriales bacterium]